MSRSIAAALFSVACIVVFVDSSMGAASDDQSEVLAIVKDYGTPAADRGIAVLGQALQGDKDKAALVFKTLEANRSIAADNVRAELLLWCGATFAENRPGKPAKGNPMSIEELGQRALPLLKHTDPFVRGIAEFAVAARLSIVTEGNVYRPWPKAEGDAWYVAWEAEQRNALMNDYVRQIAVLGAHRSMDGLKSAAAKSADRVRKQAAWAMIKATPEQATRIAGALAAFEAKLKAFEATADGTDLTKARVAWLEMRSAVRPVIMACPDFTFNQMLFATRTGNGSGNITNGCLRDAHGAGGDLWLKTGLDPADEARPLVRGQLGLGHFRGLDINFEADRAVFSFLRQPWYGTQDVPDNQIAPNHETGLSEPAHLYEVNLASGQIRQLTNAPYNSDIEPCYLPNGDIVFCADRSNYGSQCSGMVQQDKNIVNLYRCSPDGSNIRALSNNKDFDRHPHVMENGQLVFVHWEYQERHLWQTHSLWTCRPDGSYTDAIYKQHITTGPMSLRESRQIPGQSKLVTIACGHHTGEHGAVMLADYTYGINEAEGMRMLTPNVSGTEGGYGKRPAVEEGGVDDAGGHYMYPYPLSDKGFLVSYSYAANSKGGPTKNFGLYYIDVWGNKELIHRDKQYSVAYLMPIRSVKKPPVLPEIQPARKYGVAMVQDAQLGMSDLKPGTVKYIRISQRLPWPSVRAKDKPSGYNHLHYTPTGAWQHVFGAFDWTPARVIGIVPVEKDGSAHFMVPADQPVYFHAMDENYCEVRRMRSNVSFQQGELRGCIGCHETRAVSPPPATTGMPVAFGRAPSMPEAASWGTRIAPGYERHIQPILDKNCVSCHNEKEAKGGVDFSSRKVDDYMQGYRTMFGIKGNEPTPVTEEYHRYWYPERKYTQDSKQASDNLKAMEANKHPGQMISISNRFSGAEVTEPLQFGSNKSKLITTLLAKTHQEHVKWNKQDWITLVTWVDLNAPYLDYYADKDTLRDQKRAVPRYVIFPDPWDTAPAGEWIMDADSVKISDGK